MKEGVIDTNILVYAFDTSESRKRGICKKIVSSVFSGEIKGIVTNQILAEYYFAVTRKIEFPILPKEARVVISGIAASENWIKLAYNEKTVARASIIHEKYNADFWDSLIAATMMDNNVFAIVTENERDFKKMPFLSAINPLK